MSRSNDPEFEAWIDEARTADIVQTARLVCPGLPLKNAGRDFHASCPVCGGKDGNEFILTPGQPVNKRFLCRKEGKGGDTIAMAMHVMGCDFISAVETINGRPPPRSISKAEPRPIDHESEQMRHEAERDRAIADDITDKKVRLRKANRAMEAFDAARPFAGSHAHAYLKARNIFPTQEQMSFLRFAPDYPFTNGVDENGNAIMLGRWPAMLALMVDIDGNAVGLHCTYLDSDKPIKAIIEDMGEDGTTRRINAKRMYGSKGLIRLGNIGRCIAVGEGIETSLGWFGLGYGPDDVTVCVAGDLGHLSGGSTGTVKHPVLVGRTIPNGVPNMEAPGMAASIPRCVEEVIILGDNDEHQHNVFAHLMTAGARLVAMGKQTSIHVSPKPEGERKYDWADVAKNIKALEVA